MSEPIYHNVGTFSTGGTWKVTSGLKWIGGVLHQAWYCLDDGKTEWKPVPSDPPFAAGDRQTQEAK